MRREIARALKDAAKGTYIVDQEFCDRRRERNRYSAAFNLFR